MCAGNPGLLDPCEKDPVDVTLQLTNQQREDITASAQVKQYFLCFLEFWIVFQHHAL